CGRCRDKSLCDPRGLCGLRGLCGFCGPRDLCGSGGRAMKWMLIVLGALAVLVVLIEVIGSRLPRDHAASRSLTVRRTPQEVWAAVTQATAASSVPVDVVEQDPPRRLVTRVKESEKMFGGTWTIAIVPDALTGSACTLTITERGW